MQAEKIKVTTPQKIDAISIDIIDDPAHTLRTELDDQSINDLAEDIKRNGLIEPVILRPAGDRYEIVAGHRRFTAVKRTGQVTINAIVRRLTDREATAIKLSENLHRKDVNLLEEAAFYAELIAQMQMTPEEIANLIGRTPEYILNRLEIIQYPTPLQEALEKKLIPLGAAQQLSKIDDPKELEILVKYAVQDGITVRNAENWVNSYFAMKASGAQQVYMEATPEVIRAAAEPLIVCQRCLTGGRLRELMQVWIHRPGGCADQRNQSPDTGKRNEQ